MVSCALILHESAILAEVTVIFGVHCKSNLLYYLLRRVLKVTTLLGRNASCRSVLMVPTSSRAKSNNIVAGNKLNSDYFSFYSLA